MSSEPRKRASHARTDRGAMNSQPPEWGGSAYVPASTPSRPAGAPPKGPKAVTGKRVGAAIAIAVALIALIVAIALFIPWKLSYDLDGGTVAEGANPTSYNMLSSVTLTAPEREGYVFAGWKGTDLEGPKKEVTIPKWSYGSRHYTATWHELIDLNVSKVVVRHGDSTVRDENNTVVLTLWGKSGKDSWEEIAETTYSESSDLVKMKYSESSRATKFVLKDDQATFADIEDAYDGYMVTAASGAAGYDVDKADGVTVTTATPAEFTLAFNPDTWKMRFFVKGNSAVVGQVRGVRVKVLCWNPWEGEDVFTPVNQHKNAYLEVRPSTSGTKATMELWKWDEEAEHSYPEYAITDPQTYYFSLEAVGYELADGTIIDADEAAPVVATVKVKGGAEVGNGKAVYLVPGENGQQDKQKGKIALVLKPRSYQVQLDPMGGKISKKANVDSYTFGKGATLPDADHVSYDHYAFQGWFTQQGNDDGTGWGEQVTQIENTEYGDKQYYAYWKVESYKIVFVTGDGASEVKGQKVKYKGTVSKPDDPTRDGYKFTGWYTDEACKTPYDFDAKVGKSMKLYAGWEKAKEKKDSKK